MAQSWPWDSQIAVTKTTTTTTTGQMDVLYEPFIISYMEKFLLVLNKHQLFKKINVTITLAPINFIVSLINLKKAPVIKINSGTKM